MKYLSEAAIKSAISSLRRSVHPFLGITFLTCKAERLAVGQLQEFDLDASTQRFMERHHRLDQESEFYFQPFKSSKYWVSSKYPSSGLQSINTRTFEAVFVRQESAGLWALNESYVKEITRILDKLSGHQSSIPLSALAIWIGKDVRWPDHATIATVVDTFVARFWITTIEREKLFIDDTDEYPRNCFSSNAPDLVRLSHEFESPPHEPSHTYGRISELMANCIGPAEQYSLEFGERLTILVGDNGLGKTFLLDLIWWVLTGSWTNMNAIPPPLENRSTDPTVKFRFAGGSSHSNRSTTMKFDYATQSWRPLSGYSPVDSVCIYANSDDGIAVSGIPTTVLMQHAQAQNIQLLQRSEIWNGKVAIIEGMVRDWANWQQAEDQRRFETFKQVLTLLSPADLGRLEPGKLTRIWGDPRPMPTILHPYGEIPIIQTSAGVRRVLMIAYIIIWAWYEHRLASDILRIQSVRNLIILVDELDAHLHPRWQRTVLPSILRLGEVLDGEPVVQVIAATHSPIVMASMEGRFSADKDTVYHLDLKAGDVTLERLDYDSHGDISRWLTSQFFGLRHAKSIEAELAIEAAKRVQGCDSFDPDEIRAVHTQLSTVLAPDDPFWRRWWYFARQWGVE